MEDKHNDKTNTHMKYLLNKISQSGELDVDDYVSKSIISVYDHWLTEDEAEKDIISYAICSNKASFKRYYNKEKLFINFFISLYNKYKLHEYKMHDKTINPINSIDYLIHILSKGLREKEDFVIFDKLHTYILINSYDLNIVLYSLRPEFYIKKLANQSNLFVLK